MNTCFAPPERTDRRIFANQVESISKNPLMSTLLEVSGGLLIVLNEERQIVGLNEAFLASIGIGDPESVLGLRLGETLNCIHAAELPYGCGTTPHCATCGAAIAMVAAIRDDQITEKTCALTAMQDGVTLERYLSVRAQPMTIDANRWILIFAQDITHQQALLTLENIFFHDVNNILTALVGSSEMLVRERPDERRARQILAGAKRLCSEVALQRYLSCRKDAAELLNLDVTYTREIKTEVEFMLHDHPAARNKRLEQQWPDGDVGIQTDINLVSRILENMLLNGLEATAENGAVRLTTTVHDGEIVWEVWNEAAIPPDVQLRIFQKHFSTKATMGRGMGTHSMKLLGERYLNGTVSFHSTPETGTTFCFRHPLNMP